MIYVQKRTTKYVVLLIISYWTEFITYFQNISARSPFLKSLVIVTMQLNSLHVFSIYWTSKSMGWLNLNYDEYWSVTSTNEMNKANQFVTYLIFKNFRPLFPGTLRVGFAKQLRPTSNVCNSFWEEQIKSFISKNQFNCLLVTFIVLNYISIRFLYLNNFFSSQKCDFILWVEWWGKNSHRMINGWW